jgi:ABC-type Na+ efflux pump permease subunit
LILFPLLFGGGFLAVSLANRGSAKDLRVAVVDHTGVSAAAVIQAAEESNRKARSGSSFGSQGIPRFSFEEVKPEADHTAQLLSLSDRIRSGELFLLLDIAPDALLVTKDPATGNIVQGEKKNPIQAAVVPLFLVYLLVMITLVGSAPNLGAVAEDKMQRVFEMLLTSASPFELMLGKVLASLGASLTSSTLYIIGGLLVLEGLAMFGLAPLSLLPWFFVYLIADVLMLSALGVALGSACATPHDAQHLAFLLFIPILVPMFLVTAIVQQPNGGLAIAMSFIPPFTPVIMLLRQALPAGVPWWQPWLGLLGVTAWAAAVIWAAARIFRIGILSQGKAPKLAELAQWVLRD